MVSYVSADRINDFFALVGLKHPGTVPVARQMMASVNVQEQSADNDRRHYPIRLPSSAPPESDNIQKRLEEVRLSALALELEMEMEMELELA